MKIRAVISLVTIFLGSSFAKCQQIAFPGAEGFGKYATGGRGGEIIIIDNLNDSGPGSFREALAQKYPRIIIFSVAGYIELESPLDIKHGDVSILGQSAPGQGITLKNYTFKATEVENVIIRYIRSRMGDEKKYEGDAFTMKKCKNAIVDHCSFSWSTDECASMYDNENITVQYCIISESLNNSVHRKGEHGYGGIWGGKKATFHHNLLADHKSRNPRFNGARYHKEPEKEIVDFRNNVIYNWMENNTYGGEEGNHNIVNNLYKAGPATIAKKNKILDPYKPYGKFYLSGNVLVGNSEVTEDNWKGVFHFDSIPWIKRSEPLKVESVKTETAWEALENVLNNSGASFARDAVDKRIVNDFRSGSPSFGTGIIDSQTQVGGYPMLDAGKVKKDEDHDGLPEKWEDKHGLDDHNADDASENTLDQNYANIEVYLNEIVVK
ncbi:MAG: pectate lyase [Cyclobacteriaceae bacterium]|nr:pectate lyase [Cyclobacteriaceae bacterium]